MKNEHKRAIIKIRKERYEELLKQQHQPEQEAQEELDVALLVKSLNSKLEVLERLPDVFDDIKNMTFAISSKLEDMKGYFSKDRVITVRGFSEFNQKFSDIKKLSEGIDALIEQMKSSK